MRKWLLHPIVFCLAIGCIAFFVADESIDRIPALLRIEANSENALRHSLEGIAASRQIAILDITESCVAQIPKQPSGDISRLVYVDLIKSLKQAGAKVLLLDRVFDRKNPVEDPVLKQSLAESSPLKVTIANSVIDDEEWQKGRPVFHSLSHVVPVVDHVKEGSVMLFGMDDIDTMVCLIEEYPKPPVPHAALMAAAQFSELSGHPTFDPQTKFVSWGAMQLKCNAGIEFGIQYTSDPDPFATMAFYEFMQATPEKQALFAKGKLIVLGDARNSSGDVTFTPWGEQPGSRFLAQSINFILSSSRAKLSSMPQWQDRILVILFGLLSAAIMLVGKALYRFSSIIALVLFAALFPGMLARGFHLVTSSPMLVLTVCVAAGLTMAIRAPYLRGLALTAPATEGTALFLDIRDSTGLIQQIGADAYGVRFRQFLDHLAPHLERTGGIIERPIGDAALCIFRKRDHANKALDFAVAALGVAERVGFSVGIGIESGLMSGQFVRESNTRVWSSFGSLINVSQRLQDLCKHHGIPIAIGENAAAQVDRELKLLGTFELRGITGESSVYTCVNPNE